jgi:hypothetical protein
MPLISLDPLPPGVLPINPDDFAIVVGIDHYVAGIQPLAGCIKDCEMFRDWLIDPSMGGLDPANVRLFVSQDPSNQEPIRDQIEDFFVDLLDRGTNGGFYPRRLYLFLAGHGLVLPPPDKQGCALVMANARMSLLRGLFGVAAADSMRLTGLFQEVMLVMDCCAEVSGRTDLSYNLQWNSDPELPARAFIHIQAAQVGATAAEVELPNPLLPPDPPAAPHPANPPVWQGVLTNAVLRGLTSAVDASGGVTARSLEQFLNGQTNCTPVVEVGDPAPPAPAMRFGNARGLTVSVNALNGAARFQVREGANFTVVIPPRLLPASLSLAPGQYLFDGLDAAGIVTSSKPHAVREEGLSVYV